MAYARFSIGIDLGTTNCAMAFVPLHGNAKSEVFVISQWDTPSSLVESTTLPSFLYLPEGEGAGQPGPGKGVVRGWIVGRFARKRAADTPGRVVHSAKSWLSHHAADRSASFLPWGSEDIDSDKKISPIHASALILNYLRGAWNNRFAGSGVEFEFDSQDITITVPASFDAGAQRLTLEAAKDAGFPASVRLLEEPQSAFYRWLEQGGSTTKLFANSLDNDAKMHHVLVIDIGGGTSDFSLFEIQPTDRGSLPAIKRIAVSDHILLGGDNIDIAIAHLVERRIKDKGTNLSGGQWEVLIAHSRDLKERCLSENGLLEEIFSVAIPGRGSGLVAGALSAQISRADIESVLLEGFFPECKVDARPWRAQTALKEWGLPFATDSAITRHLAGFLNGRPSVDAVLLNGGSLYPERLRQRLCSEIGKWQNSPPPLVLENAEPDLAVARGAARFGKILFEKAERIEAGAARAIFLEVHAKQRAEKKDGPPTTLVCILPRGSAPEDTFEIDNLAFELRVNCPVRFQVFSSTRHNKCKAGTIVEHREREFHALPPLETIVNVLESDQDSANQTISVTLSAKLNELGLLQVSCVDTDHEIRRSWPLEFNLRPHEQSGSLGSGIVSTTGAPIQAEPNVAPDKLDAARAHIDTVFTQPLGKREKLTSARLFNRLETILDLPKSEWNWVLIRALWTPLEACMARRATSVEHEETWLITAGFFLRPGFGAAMDDARIDGLWRLNDQGLFFPGKRIKLQTYILWRRVAGGLSPERQKKILAPELPRILQQENLPPELIRLAGALERLGHETKTLLVNHFIDTVLHLIETRKYCEPWLAALGLLLNRTPLHAGPETVVSPELVERTFIALSGFDWARPELRELHTIFLRAARVTGNRSIDIPESLRNKIAGKLEKSGVAPAKTAKIRAFTPIECSERSVLFGEPLPPGLILGEG